MADGFLAKGTALLALGRSAAAIAALEQAQRGFEQVVEISGNVAARRGLARTRVALATALWELRPADQRARARAAELMSQALSWYQTAGAGNERQREEIEAWRQARGLAAETAPPGEAR
jgi:hypothetical protein